MNNKETKNKKINRETAQYLVVSATDININMKRNNIWQLKLISKV